MVFQIGIKLDVDNRDVQANLDFDTGFIGFTEKSGDEVTEYYFHESPKEFRLAFFDKLELLFDEKNHFNSKICRKNKNVLKFAKELSEERNKKE